MCALWHCACVIPLLPSYPFCSGFRLCLLFSLLFFCRLCLCLCCCCWMYRFISCLLQPASCELLNSFTLMCCAVLCCAVCCCVALLVGSRSLLLCSVLCLTPLCCLSVCLPARPIHPPPPPSAFIRLASLPS